MFDPFPDEYNALLLCILILITGEILQKYESNILWFFKIIIDFLKKLI